jgi:hypothetical protein
MATSQTGGSAPDGGRDQILKRVQGALRVSGRPQILPKVTKLLEGRRWRFVFHAGEHGGIHTDRTAARDGGVLARQPQMLRADQQGVNRTIQFRLLRPASL